MKSSDQRLQGLVTWAQENLSVLRHEPAKVIADKLGDQMLHVNDHLGVEVEDDDSGIREVIVTAFSEPSLFPLVRKIVGMLVNIPDWRFVALKPPRGFEFTLSIGQEQIAAKSLEFSPIKGVEGGIQLLVPLSSDSTFPRGQQAEEMAWLVVETGIGEELAGRLQHIEFSSVEGTQDRRPIAELGAYVRAECQPV